MRSLASVCLLLAACGPVLLTADGDPNAPSAPPQQPMDASVTSPADADAAVPVGQGATDDAVPHALITVRPADCGSCFELVAGAVGGRAPYEFEWEDGSHAAERRVCPDGSIEVSLIVRDAASARSSAYVTRLETAADASCPPIQQPTQKLCVMNASFEGTPAANLGVPETFDAAPWSACTNPEVTNTPDIGTNTGAGGDAVPAATDGDTFLSLATAEQASQELCETVQAGTELNIELDLAFVDPGAAVGTEPQMMSLEIWGGLAADCVQRERLWTSPPIEDGWKRYCVTLTPTQFMDQITLRATGDASALVPGFILADHLVPVDACP